MAGAARGASGGEWRRLGLLPETGGAGSDAGADDQLIAAARDPVR